MRVWNAIGRAPEQGFVGAQIVHCLTLELSLSLLLYGHRLLLERLVGLLTLGCLVMSGTLTNHSLRISASACPIRKHA